MLSENRKSYAVVGWLICALGAIFYSYEYLLRIAPSVMEQPLREHFNLAAMGFGHLSASYYWAYVPMQLPVGVLLDRYGPRRLLTFACAVCVMGTFLFTSTNIVAVATIGRFLVGLGSSFAFVGVLKLATIWLPENRLAMISGMTAALGTLGAMLGDNLLEPFVHHYGWVLTLNTTAYFGIALTFILWLGVHDKQGRHRQAGTVGTFKQSFADLRIILRNRQIWVNGLYGCLVYMPTTVFAELWGIPYLTHAHGLTVQDAGLANSLLFLGFTLGAPLMGYVSDRLGRRKFPMRVGAGMAACLMAVILYFPGLTQHQVQILMFLLGLMYSAQAIVFAVGRELSPSEAGGTAMAITNMIVMLAAMILQPLVGDLLDLSFALRSAEHVTDKLAKVYTLGDYQFALAMLPVGMCVAVVLTFFLKETYAKVD